MHALLPKLQPQSHLSDQPWLAAASLGGTSARLSRVPCSGRPPCLIQDWVDASAGAHVKAGCTVALVHAHGIVVLADAVVGIAALGVAHAAHALDGGVADAPCRRDAAVALAALCTLAARCAKLLQACRQAVQATSSRD